MVLVLKKAGVGVFLQLLRVLHKEITELGLLPVSSHTKLAAVWDVNLKSGTTVKLTKCVETTAGFCCFILCSLIDSVQICCKELLCFTYSSSYFSLRVHLGDDLDEGRSLVQMLQQFSADVL